ncbi:transcriptional initiation protein Tat [Pseudoroseomonas deserti]|uniref:Transcriptional initiation protein Tat n=1 Tax=Teichococcus deserti TaxID=1817963 RepID=A0A1V2H9Q2_9PROT|nr:YncE family protein [Pseudoroseomonas deserti]ONG58655.1 transcriptional initiation protein Tat [Pseudoroseomonas deserti]
MPTVPALGRRPLLGLAGLGLLAVPARAAEPAVTRREIGVGLYELAYSARQKAVFVAASGGFGENSVDSRVLRLDPATLAVQAEIPLPLKGFGVALDEASGRLYVGHSTEASVSVIDIAANKLVGTLRLAEKVRAADGKESAPYSLRELRLDATGATLYIPGFSTENSVLYVVDAKAMTLKGTVTGMGPGAIGIAVDSANQRVFLSSLLGRLYTVDAKAVTLAKDVAAGGLEQPMNLEFDAATGQVLAVDQGLESMPGYQAKMQPGFTSKHPGNRVARIDPADGRLVAEGPAPKGPLSLLLDEAGGRVFVASREDGAIAVLDARTLASRATVALPKHPNSLAFDAAGKMLYVSVKNGRDVPRNSAESVARIAF